MTQKLSKSQQALVAKATTLVRILAVAFRTDKTTEDELVSAGNEALTLAALRYREDEGPFEVFARLAIRGAMLRTLGKEHRARRSLTRFADAAGPSLEAPKEASLDEVFVQQAADDSADVVASLERVVAGYLAVHAVRAAQGEETILALERQDQIVRALENVDPDDRRAFLAHLVEGKTHEECMAELGVKKRTLQRRIERAEETVRKALRS